MSDCRFGVSPVNYPDPDTQQEFLHDTRGVKDDSCTGHQGIFLMTLRQFLTSFSAKRFDVIFLAKNIDISV